MDDTAVSKVRDPSVSISLGADDALGVMPRGEPQHSHDAVVSVLLGTAVGALVVVGIVFVVRLLMH